jgi:hypothetical protein
LPLHASELVAGHAAEIDVVTGLLRPEHDRCACAPAGDAWRLGILLGEHDVMFSAFAVEQRDLHDLTYGGREDGIHLAVDCSADTEIDHAPICNP